MASPEPRLRRRQTPQGQKSHGTCQGDTRLGRFRNHQSNRLFDPHGRPDRLRLDYQRLRFVNHACNYFSQQTHTLVFLESCRVKFFLLIRSFPCLFLLSVLMLFILISIGNPVLAQDQKSTPTLLTTEQRVSLSFGDLSLLQQALVSNGRNSQQQPILCDDWRETDSGFDGVMNHIAQVRLNDQDVLVILGSAGTYFTSVDEGETWTQQIVPGGYFLTELAWNQDEQHPVFAISTLGEHQQFVFLVSADLHTWDRILIPGSDSAILDSVSYGNGQFVAVGTQGDIFGNSIAVFSSVDGSNWIDRSPAPSIAGEARTVIHDNSRFIIGGSTIKADFSTSGLLLVTEDFTSFDRRLIGNLNPRAIHFDARSSRYVIASSSRNVGVSADLDNWTAIPVDVSLRDLAFSGEEYIGVGEFGDEVVRSQDGHTWTQESLETPLQSVTWIPDRTSQSDMNGKFVAVGRSFGETARIFEQSCREAPCLPSVSITPGGIAQGLNPIVFTAQADCILEPVTYTWSVEGQPVLDVGQSITLQPDFNQTTSVSVQMTDQGDQVFSAQAKILVSLNPNLVDPNGDGQNTIEDLRLVATHWRGATLDFDSDGDETMSVLDLVFVPRSN